MTAQILDRENPQNDCDRAPSTYEQTFQKLAAAIPSQLKDHQHFTLSLSGEESQFTRFNRAKVRQTGQVRDGQMSLHVMTGDRTASITLPFTGNFETDWPLTQSALSELQPDFPHLPIDPYVVLPTTTAQNTSREVRSGHLLEATEVAEQLLSPVKSLDFSGLYAGGLSYRAYADSAGKRHWFETPSFTLDYSLFGNRLDQAAKGTVAGDCWDTETYRANVAVTQRQLELLSRPVKTVPRGSYRTYLAPDAVAGIIDTMAWGGLGEAALRQGNSAFNQLENGELTLSKKFSLREDFNKIGIPRFNNSGEVSSTQLPIIEQGEWANSLVSRRSAKEYGKSSNAANTSESMRAPAIAPGTLSEAQILSQLDTGLYLSNLHYLNWSDLVAGSITGMTRYACFWVENGEIVAPIENLRFDDNLYRFLGQGLIDLTTEQRFIPAVDTYNRRSLGGMWTPGMLIEQFRYTL
ncbi:TldD/PmbA family protein [cf. Phormidesmis sp. LEGE 11477]|uniref:TldD/PmbA family protein n=1 Tax=cf. Phormidesmis sp. LEGE 11477 TaxID=1828680 RepID=UPI00187FB021|nr:metallopeptidase TldD-related protein [cf. Phormidesmis sp. LEGE 11477]MBE9061621.1 TldD/PmbA family protein [cf. Phormidesmis sp. LEGE 11477]